MFKTSCLKHRHPCLLVHMDVRSTIYICTVDYRVNMYCISVCKYVICHVESYTVTRKVPLELYNILQVEIIHEGILYSYMRLPPVLVQVSILRTFMCTFYTCFVQVHTTIEKLEGEGKYCIL